MPAPPRQVASAILDVQNWPQWWDGLESATVAEPQADIIGSRIECTWRSLTGYRLTLGIVITTYTPERTIVFTSSGDLVGGGSWTFEPTAEKATKMEIVWQVATEKGWMNLLAPVLRPLFIYSHNLLMRRGERGLRKYLA